MANLSFYRSWPRAVPGGTAHWELILSGTVPATTFRLNREFEGALVAAGAPWLSGQARFKPARPPSTGEWYECKGKREARTRGTTGSITGDLTVLVIGYESITVADREARAVRSRVRSRN